MMALKNPGHMNSLAKNGRQEEVADRGNYPYFFTYLERMFLIKPTITISKVKWEKNSRE
jgi:hypothetical protein